MKILTYFFFKKFHQSFPSRNR